MKKGICVPPGQSGDDHQIRYFIDYQYMAKGDLRPRAHGETVGIRATDSQGVVVLPNVGDYVTVDPSGGDSKIGGFSGRVKSRYFRYFQVRQGFACYVNIVVEDIDDDFEELLTEG